MMNIPGNIIRGAGSVVGGTVSAVASAAGVGGRKVEMPGDLVVKEKTVLTIKVKNYSILSCSFVCYLSPYLSLCLSITLLVCLFVCLFVCLKGNTK